MGDINVNSKQIIDDQEEEDAQVQMWDYIFGFSKMAVVKCAIQLGIADAIENHKQPMTLSELSTLLKCSPPLLYRIMRFLVHYKFFKEQCTSRNTTGYVNTSLSRRLLKQAKSSMVDFVLLESSHVMLAPWHALSTRVLENGISSAFAEANGRELWRYAQENLDHGKLFNDAMASDAPQIVPALVQGCPQVLEGIQTLVDVGGGYGTTLNLLVKACPWIHGINFDVPHVVSVAPEFHGVEHVAGDMFKSVPKADAAFLKWILHDWNDEECIQILKNCREAIPKDKGKVIIVEAVVDAEKNDKFECVRLMMDMAMLAHTDTGRERTSKELEYVLHQAGFTHFNIIPIRAIQSLIVAFP